MPQRAKIPLTKGLYKNSDPLETSDFATELKNFNVTTAGAINKRPGLYLAVDLGTNKPVEGLYWFNEGGYALAVSDGRVYKITRTSGVYSATELAGSTLRNASATGGAGRATFTDDGTNVFIANGGAINYHVSASSTAQPLADADAPTAVTHVAYLDGYILANGDGTSRFYWSNLGSSLQWSATAFASAEGDSDWILNLSVGYRELALFGEQSIEIWYNDGTTPFSRLPGAYIQRGITSQDSVQFISGDWFFLDDKNNVCRMKDREVVEISKPIEKELKSLGNLSDAISDQVDADGQTYYVLSFPTAGRTFAWKVSDDRLDGWQEWTGDEGAGRFRGQCHARCYGWSTDLWGDKSSGKIMLMSTDYVDDLNQYAIYASRRTGWIDHGTTNYKNCIGLTFKFRDAVNANVTAPTLSYRWRDDGSSTWGSWNTVSMTGDGIKRVFQLGRYRMRQWEFKNEERCLTDLVDVTEDIEVMTA